MVVAALISTKCEIDVRASKEIVLTCFSCYNLANVARSGAECMREERRESINGDVLRKKVKFFDA